MLHPLEVLPGLGGFLAVRKTRQKIFEGDLRVIGRSRIVGAGSRRFRPNITDLVLGIDCDRIVREFLHDSLIRGDGGLVLALFLARPAEIELRPGRVLSVGRGANNQGEDLRGLLGAGFDGNAQQLRLLSGKISFPDPKHSLDRFLEALALRIFLGQDRVTLRGEQIFMGLFL